ncbi:unnamed protein product, partial [Laminaria digitata]
MCNTGTRSSVVLKITCGSQKKCCFGIFVLAPGGKILRICWKPLWFWNLEPYFLAAVLASGFHIWLICGNTGNTVTSALPLAVLHVPAKKRVKACFSLRPCCRLNA